MARAASACAGDTLPSTTQHDGAGRPAQRAAAPFVFGMVKIRHALAYARPARLPDPLTDCAGCVRAARAQEVCCGQSLRVGALPRVGELRVIAYYRAERPRVPAAAAERRAALYNTDLSVHPGGGLRLMALYGRCGPGCWRLPAPGRSAPTGPV